MAFNKRKALQAALAYTKQGRLEKAVLEYEAILKADPNDLSTHNILGDLYARMGAISEAIAQYLKLAELYRAEDLAVKAIAVYKKVIKLDPENLPAYLTCADLYAEQGLIGEAKLHYTMAAERCLRAGEVHKALELYRKVASLDPSNLAVVSKLTELLVRQGMVKEASAQLHQAAQAALKAGQVGEARQFFRKMAELEPGSLEAHYGLGKLLMEIGAYEEAEKELTLAASADSANPLPLVCMGEVYQRAGKLSEAEAAYRRVLLIDPEAEEARLALGQMCLEAGRIEEAFEQYAVLAERWRKGGEFKPAAELFQRILSISPAHVGARERLAQLLAEAGDVVRAKGELLCLAVLYEEAGNVADEAAIYRRVLALDPADPTALARLQELEAVEEAATPVEALPGARPRSPESELIEEPPEEAGEEIVLQVEEPVAVSPAGVEGESEVPVESDIAVSPVEEETQGLELEHFGEEAWSAPRPVALDERPEEFQPLPEEETQAVGVGGESLDFSEDLAEADFYLEQGMIEEAKVILRCILAQDSQNAEAERRLAQAEKQGFPSEPIAPLGAVATPSPPLELDREEIVVEDQSEEGLPTIRVVSGVAEPVEAVREESGLDEAALASEASSPQEAVPVFTVASEGEMEEDFIGLSAELGRELVQGGAEGGAEGPTLEEVLAELRRRGQEELREEDFEVHYNLGIAYKEMDLFDEAIEELRLASRDQKRAPRCSRLLGLCYLAKGRPELAIQEFQRGLSLSGFTPEEYQSLKYDLATAYEALEDLPMALAILEGLQAEDPQFEDVMSRIHTLRTKLQGHDASPEPQSRVAHRPSSPPDPAERDRGR